MTNPIREIEQEDILNSLFIFQLNAFRYANLGNFFDMIIMKSPLILRCFLGNILI